MTLPRFKNKFGKIDAALKKKQSGSLSTQKERDKERVRKKITPSLMEKLAGWQAENLTNLFTLTKRLCLA